VSTVCGRNPFTSTWSAGSRRFRTVAVPVAVSATRAGAMGRLMLSNCSGAVKALTGLRELSRCLTFSVKDQCVETSSAIDASLPQARYSKAARIASLW